MGATTEGRNLLVKIASSTNKFRYSTNTDGPVTPPTQEDVNKVLSIEPPFDLNSGDSHFTLSRKYTIKKGGRLGFSVYVYKEGFAHKLKVVHFQLTVQHIEL